MERAVRCGQRSDAALIDRVLRGDTVAGEAFAARYVKYIASVLRDLGFRCQEGEDLSQQVFVHLWEDDCRRLRLWQRSAPFSAYLRRIIVRLAQDHWRRRRGGESLGLEAVDEVVGADVSSVEGQVEARLACEALMRCTRRLSRREARLIALRHVDGLSYREIAETCEMTVNHVGVALWKAERRLRSEMQPWR